jgi:hypothetical protein
MSAVLDGCPCGHGPRWANEPDHVTGAPGKPNHAAAFDVTTRVTQAIVTFRSVLAVAGA